MLTRRWFFSVGNKRADWVLYPKMKFMGGLIPEGMRHSRNNPFPWPFTPTGRHAKAYQQKIKEVTDEKRASRGIRVTWDTGDTELYLCVR